MKTNPSSKSAPNLRNGVIVNEKVKQLLPRVEYMVDELLFLTIKPVADEMQEEIRQHLIQVAVSELSSAKSLSHTSRNWSHHMRNRMEKTLLSAALEHISMDQNAA